MIEVLKRGNKKTVVCESCGAELRYQPEDVKMYKPMEGIAGYINYITCPECQDSVALPVSHNFRTSSLKDSEGGAYEIPINRTH